MFVIYTIMCFIYTFAHMHDLSITILSFINTFIILCYLSLLLHVSSMFLRCVVCFIVYFYRCTWLSILLLVYLYFCIYVQLMLLKIQMAIYTIVYLIFAHMYVSSILLSVVYISIDIGVDDFLHILSILLLLLIYTIVCFIYTSINN